MVIIMIKKALFRFTGLLLVFSFFSFHCTGELSGGIATSPNGTVSGEVFLDEDGALRYSIFYNGQAIIAASKLSLAFKNQDITFDNLVVRKVEHSEGSERFRIYAGKSSGSKARYNQVDILMQEKEESGTEIILRMRAYNDGLAFRYIIPEQQGFEAYCLVSENTEFVPEPTDSCWALNLRDYTTAYESEFLPFKVSELTDTLLIGLPLVVEKENGITYAILEAALEKYSGMYLKVSDNHGKLITSLAPSAKNKDVCVTGNKSLTTPWRVVMIGESAGDLIESDIILQLNKPSILGDNFGWIRPGKVAWNWWSGTQVAEDAGFEAGMNTKTFEYYIDFAEEYNLEYVLIDAGWYGPFGIDDHDILNPVPELNIRHLVHYAKERNVKLILWVHWAAMDAKMEAALALYQAWGIAGVKVDYMNANNQEMVDFYHRLLVAAAKYEMLVDLHGAYCPTGIRRTYPHLMTREGILGLEYNKWSDRVTPEHNVIIPFTRMIAGPMDYTPGGMRHKTKETFEARNDLPFTMGTRAHNLAMYVVYESPLQMVSDYPEAYRLAKGAELLRHVPVSWHETRVLAGEIGDYIVIARRKADGWYVGGMSDEHKRTITIPLDFLTKEKIYDMKMYADTEATANDPEEVGFESKKVLSTESIEITMQEAGGFVAWFIPDFE